MSLTNTPWPEPTSDQCTNHARMVCAYYPNGKTEVERFGMCAWYPQMGGYVGKCIIETYGTGCADVYVWHDGEFPFGEASSEDRRQAPVRLHHCAAEQFEDFAKDMREAAKVSA